MNDKVAREARGDRGGVQSVETGTRLIAVMSQLTGPQMLKTIAKQAGMPPAKVHRYLMSFCKAGLVERDPASGLYGLGPLALQVGLAALRGLDVVQIASQALVSLRDKVGETVALAVWGADGPIVVRMEEASQPVTVHLKVGSVMPLSSSATGRAMAAFMPSTIVNPIVGQELKSNRDYPQRAHLITSAKVEKVFEEVRQHGIAQVTGELLPGISALAAPIFDYTGRPIAAIVALGASEAFDSSLHGPIACALADVTSQITMALGGTPPRSAAPDERLSPHRRAARSDRRRVQVGVSVRR